ncbi:MAG: zf-TFIIB domain-containing protein [Archangium sp.]|nr:zf-TFIIB domain-containing protein [Archangium sp.]
MVICPDCRQRMQAFFVPARSGSGEVELDRCGQCSSLWFNAGEVEAALGRSIRRRQGSTTRSCPTCRVKLDAAVLEGRVDVERCGRCQGVFLDGHDVAVLGQKKSKPRASSSGSGGFECEACGERRPFGEAQSTVTGLICAACATKANAKEPEVAEEQRSLLGRFFSWFGSGDDAAQS